LTSVIFGKKRNDASGFSADDTPRAGVVVRLIERETSDSYVQSLLRPTLASVIATPGSQRETAAGIGLLFSLRFKEILKVAFV